MKVETWIGALDGSGDDTRRPWRFYLWWVTVVWLGHLLQGYLDHLFSYQTVNCANPSTRSQPNNWRTNGEPCTWWFDKKGGVQSFKKLKRGVQWFAELFETLNTSLKEKYTSIHKPTDRLMIGGLLWQYHGTRWCHPGFMWWYLIQGLKWIPNQEDRKGV